MTATNDRSLRFALGPVQSFFAQSRRTRDLWSSSFLVSYLSACAVDAFKQAGAQVVLPDVEDDRLVAAVREVRNGSDLSDPPEIGSVPNQLTVEAQDPAMAARAAEQRIADAWQRITDAVWDRIVKVASHGRGTRTIWERQLDSFWQIHWAVGGAESLKRRKAWRGGPYAGEPGDKCTLMAGWQELSGCHRATERPRQDRFWSELRRELRSFDVAEGERLCALALVKRLFPSVATQAIGWALDTVHWPSTPYLAARPWMEAVLAHGSPAVHADAEAFAELVVDQAPPAHGRELGADRIEAADSTPARSKFLFLGGSYVFMSDLELEERTPLVKEENRPVLIELLNEVYDEAAKAVRRRRPSAFYALLQLDGDRLGKLFAESGDPSKTSRDLARFAREAVELVRKQQGLPLYAGGDDLVAFLPLPTALSTAVALAALYESILDPGSDGRVTTSAALVYAHCRSPLRSVVAEGHRMLEDDAKDANGRGSLAVAVWKASGVTARWVTTWEQLVPDWSSPPIASEITTALHRLGDVSGRVGDAEVSTSFLYGQRDVLTRLAGREPWRPGLTVELPKGIEPEALVRAELARAREQDPDEVAGLARDLTELMQPGRRNADGDSEVEPGRLAFDPLLLAHVLDQERPGGAP